MTRGPQPDHSFTVDAEHAGKTLAAVVREHLGGIPWSKARSLCRGGQVELDGVIERNDARRVTPGSTVQVFVRRPARVEHPDDPAILHVDRDLVVVLKPADLVSVPFDERDTDTLVGRTEQALRRRFGPCPPLRVVQRLDKDTTGVLVFARTRRAERRLQEQFREHSVKRRYLGLAVGAVRAATHRSHLIPDRGDGLRGSFRGAKPPAFARHAVTHVHPTRVFEVPASLREGANAPSRVTLVSCQLETGRQHQIRIHLAESGHPLVGERVYIRDHRAQGGGYLAGYDPNRGRPLLHAERLGFVHPSRESEMEFDAPLPSDFAELLRQLEGTGE